MHFVCSFFEFLHSRVAREGSTVFCFRQRDSVTE